MEAVVIALMLVSAGLFLVPEASAWHCSDMPYWAEIPCRVSEAACALVCRVIAIEGSDGVALLP